MIKLTTYDRRVNGIYLLRWAPYVRIWVLDLQVKYWEPLTWDDKGSILLVPGERSVELGDATDDSIELTVEGFSRKWWLSVDCARYTCIVIAYRGERWSASHWQMRDWFQTQSRRFHDVVV